MKINSNNGNPAIPGKLVLPKPLSHAHKNLIAGLLSDKLGYDACRSVSTLSNFHQRFIDDRIYANKCSSLESYVGLMRESDYEFQLFLTEHLNKETQFFRTPGQLSLFNSRLDTMFSQLHDSKSLMIWCAGCATGEEAYSLAMIMKSRPDFSDWNVKIVATDVVASSLETARKGVYSKPFNKSMAGNPFHEIYKSFTYDDGSKIVVADSIKDLVIFMSHNLLDGFEFLPNVIFCRNVIIYFDHERQVNILRKFFDYLLPGGYLFLGYSEAIKGFGDEKINLFEDVHGDSHFAYRKPLVLGV